MHVPGGHTGGATPVPIPNTEVKPSKADATAAVRPWESRTLPGYKKACWSKIQQAFSFSSIECVGEPGHPLCSPNAHAQIHRIFRKAVLVQARTMGIDQAVLARKRNEVACCKTNSSRLLSL
jgi:hypothetical protein